MGIEIERKFLLLNSDWKEISNQSINIKQGYLNSDIERTVRVRIIGNKGMLTIKGKTINTTRLEFEYEIPLEDAEALIILCEKSLIEKTRYEVKLNGVIWEIDVFEGNNKGLIIAEIELDNENQKIEIPDWIGKEVSHDERYYNSSLINNPFMEWSG